MKPVRGLAEAPPALRRYCDNPDKTQNWDAFRGDGDGRTAYQELSQVLVSTQRGLCCYCEATMLVPDDRQIEHVLSREHHPHLALVATNMLASCKGGGESSLVGFPDRYLPNPGDSLSCGQRKAANDALDPRTLPTDRLFVITTDGRIIVDPVACQNAGFTETEAERAISALGLDVRRLTTTRAKIMQQLREYDEYSDDALEREAEEHLLPNNDGMLKDWFTTRRSYFGATAEQVLARPPQSWIGA